MTASHRSRARRARVDRRGRSRGRRLQAVLESLESRTVLSAMPVGGQFLVDESLSPPENTAVAAILDTTPGTGGRFISVWQTYGADGFDVVARVYDRDGTALGAGPFAVNEPAILETGDGNQIAASVASDGNGRFVVAWQSEDTVAGGYDVYYRMGTVDGAGAVTLSAPVRANTLTTLGDQKAPAVAMANDGDFVLAWQGDAAGGTDVFYKRGTTVGLGAGDEVVVNTYTTGDQASPRAAIDVTTGDFVITWRGPDPAAAGEEGEVASGVFFKVFNGDTLADTGDVRANASAYNDIVAPSVAMNSAGGIVVAWQVEGSEGSGSDVYGRRFTFSRGPATAAPLATATAGTGDFAWNTTTAKPQRAPTVGIDADGDIFAAWQSQQQDGFSWGIYGRRYDAGGDAFSAELLVNTGIQSGPQVGPRIAMDATGRTVAVWVGPLVPELEEGGRQPSIRGQIYDDAGGTAVGDELSLATFVGLEDQPAAVAADAAGNFVVVWQSWEAAGDGSDFGIYAKLFQADGTPIDLDENGLDDDTLLVNTLTVGGQSSPAVAMDAAGNFVVVWKSTLGDAAGTSIRGRRYDASFKGWADEEDFTVNATTAGDQSAPAVAMDSAGNFMVVWVGSDEDPDTVDVEGTGIFGRRFAADGTPQPGGEFRVNAERRTSQSGPAIAMNAAGAAAIAWVSDHNVLVDPEDTEKSIYVAWYSAAGDRLVAEDTLANSYTKDAQESPAVGIDAAGDFTLVWQSINQELNLDGAGSSWGVYGRQFVIDEEAGTISSPQSQEFRVNQTVAESQRFPAIGVDAAGRFAVAWQTIGQDAASWGIYARQYAADGLPVGSESRVNTGQAGPQILPAVAQRAAGDFGIFWSGQGLDRIEGTSGQRYRLIADDFNRDSQPSLGPDWTARVGSYDIQGNVAAVQTPLGVATLDGVNLTDVAVEALVVLGGPAYTYGGVIARYTGPGDANMYWGGIKRLEGEFSAEIWKQVGGSWSLVGTRAVSTGTGVVRLEVIGDALRLFFDDELVVFANDRSIMGAGGVGIRGSAETTADDFRFVALQTVTGKYTFRDFFNLSTGSQPSRFWVDRAGDFTIDGNAAVGRGSVNNATLNAPPASDGTVQATVVADVSGSYAGVSGRYTGFGDRDLYWAGLANRSNDLFAEIWRIQNGGYLRLASTPLPAADASVAHDVRFDLVGDALRLTVNGAPVATAADAALGGPGAFGIRTGAGGVVREVVIEEPTAVTLPYSTSFTAEADGSLGSDWSTRIGEFSTVGSTAVAQATLNLATLNTAPVADLSATASLLVDGDAEYAGFAMRYTGPGDSGMVWGGLANRGGTLFAELWRNLGAGWSLVASTTLVGVPAGVAHTVRMDAEGTALRVFVDGQLRTFANDGGVVAAGLFALRSSGGVTFDDLVVTPLSAAPASLPFASGFDATADGLLSDQWNEPVGWFSTATSAAVGQTALNLALLNGVASVNADMTALIGVPVVGSYAGFASRAAGGGDSNLLWGGIVNRGGALAAELWANQGGVWRLLGAAAAPGDVAVGHTVRMVASGPTLRLDVDGVTLLTRTTELLAAGGVGIRGSAGASLDDLAIVAG
jgi:hypothetical protein